MKVSIIGTCGRSNKNKLSKSIFYKMCRKAYSIIIDDFKLDTSKICLVSGGAAWSDHIALKLYKSKNSKDQKLFNKCIIYLPCKFTDNKRNSKLLS